MENEGGNARIDNIELNDKEGYALVRLNPKLYPLDVIYSASYSFLERAYIILDGDAEKEVVVRIRPKSEGDGLEEVSRAFNDELLKYASYKVFSEANSDIRRKIVERALLTNCGCEEAEDDYLEDPLGIAKPWEETHGSEEDASTENTDDSDGQGGEEDYIDDPLGIAKPWEETHGKEKKDG